VLGLTEEEAVALFAKFDVDSSGVLEKVEANKDARLSPFSGGCSPAAVDDESRAGQMNWGSLVSNSSEEEEEEEEEAETAS